MFEKIIWSNEYITGHEELDNYHKKIIELYNKILGMLKKPEINIKEIEEKNHEFISILLEHMDIESELLEKYNIPGYRAHIQEHEYIKNSILNLNKFNIPILLNSISIADIVCDYFFNHFIKYDKIHLSILNKRIKEAKQA